MARTDATSNLHVRRRIRDLGGDGVRLDNGSDSVWLAPEPTQIKSALANNGGLDAKNMSVLFSRGAADIGQQVTKAIKAVTITNVKNK